MLARVLIIGGGVAATRCALELRTQGYDGRICMVSAETTLPYDRTLVSKELLSGDRVDDARSSCSRPRPTRTRRSTCGSASAPRASPHAPDGSTSPTERSSATTGWCSPSAASRCARRA